MSTIRALLERSAARTPQKIFCAFKDAEITYEDFLSSARRAGNGFLSLGVRKGDRVAILLDNCLEFPYAWLGANMIGAVMVPVNTRLAAQEMAHILRHSGAKALVTSNELLGKIEVLRSEVPSLSQIATIDEPPKHAVSFAELLTSSDDLPPVDLDPQKDLAVILYTSGTTGAPKGCMASHEYFLNLAEAQAELFQLTEDDRVLTAQPFYYIDPQWNTLMVLCRNATLVLSERFSTSRFWDEIRRHGVTCFYCIGSMTSFLYNMPPSPLDRQHKLRLVQTSGISPQIHKAWEERFNVPVHEVYASTETTLDIAVPIGANRKAGTACIGRPMPYREAKIVDEENREVVPGVVGEIVLKRGKGMMLGYYRDEAATEHAFRGGWFHSGDLGWVDQDGDYHFAGRKKDIIRRGGENISAAAIEQALMTHPDILEAAAIPVPDRIRGEEVKVYIVPRPGSPLTYADVVNFSTERLGVFKVPRYIEFRDVLPKTPSERVRKEFLKKERADLTEGCFDRLTAEGSDPR